MTTIKVLKKNEDILEISVTGHTDYGVEGEDILCASISSIVQTAGLALINLVKGKTIVSRNERIPQFKLSIKNNLSSQDFQTAQIILKTCYLGLKDLADGYPKNIKMEENNNVY